jgi:hypothetical protein
MGNIANRVLLADYLGGQASGAVMGRNYIKNPSGLFNTNNISVANSATVARNTGTPLTRIADIEVVLPNNTNGYAEWAANTMDLSLGGQNCELRFDYIASSIGSAVYAQVLDTGTVVAQQQLALSSSPRQFSLNVPCNSTGATTTVRITNATGNSGTSNIKVANVSYSKASNVGTTAQASFYGSATTAGTANCNWSRTSNQSFGSFSADSDCPTPSVEGNAAAPATKIPAIRFPNMAPGDYQFTATGMFFASGTNQPCSFRFSDGTNSTSAQVVFATGSPGMPVISGKISYATAGDRTIEVQATGRDGNYPCDILANTATTTPFRIDVVRFPSSSEIAVRPEQLPGFWNGYHGSNCTYSRSGTSLGDFPADSVCDFVEMQNVNFGTVTSQLSGSDKLPGIVFTPRRAGRYLIIANFSGLLTAGGTSSVYELYDGTNSLGNSTFSSPANEYIPHTLQGIVNATSTSPVTVRIRGAAASGDIRITGPGSPSTSHIRWTIIALDQALPAPLLVGSVTSNSSGLERVERATVNEFTTCTSSPCTITRQSGSWLTSVTRSSTGNFTLDIAAGVFSATPSCSWSVTNAFICRSVSSGNTPTSIGLDCRNQAGGADDLNTLYVTCMGPR